MASIELTAGELLLDLENPRISKASSQREALQKIIEDQDEKLVVLAKSIIEDGLNPMDRWLVVKSSTERGKYDVLEGNRRLAVIKILNNPAVLKDLEVTSPVRRKLEELSEAFNLRSIEPIDCYELATRAESAAWLNQRHTGQNKGRGIVDWSGVQTARFRGRDPALQALEFVLEHGGLAEEEREAIEDRFPITTLDRLLSTPAVREKIGVEISDSKLTTSLPASEALKPLRRIVLDLATEVTNVSKLKSKQQQIDYVSALGRDLPDLKKLSADVRAIDAIAGKEFKQSTTSSKQPKKPKPKAQVRKTLIPRDCYLTVSNPKIAEISRELRSLALSDYPHSISVLFRVFLEQSTDHHLTAAKISLSERRRADPRTRA
jgi:hypothetical protein